MSNNEDPEYEAKRLVTGHVAENLEQARKIIETLEAQRARADAYLFYHNDSAPMMRVLFYDMIQEDENSYMSSSIRYTRIPSGSIGRVADKKNGDVVLGRIKELVSKDSGTGRNVGVIRNMYHAGKSGIFLTPWKAEEVRARSLERGGRGILYDESNDLYRVEYEPVRDDPVLGMFAAWNQHKVLKDFHLGLYHPVQHTFSFA